MERRHPNVVNLDEVAPTHLAHGQRYALERRQLGAAAGGHALGASHVTLPPGKRAWPLHWHATNEEAIFVLEGAGELEIGDRVVPIRAGDYMAFKTGPGHAHRVTNTGDAPLRYLVVSTMNPTDIGVYPETNKIGVFSGSAPGGPVEARTLHAFLRRDATVGYWDGEPEE